MLFLINDILDYSQLESKSMLLNYKTVDVKDIVNEVIAILKFKADLKSLDFSLKLSNDL